MTSNSSGNHSISSLDSGLRVITREMPQMDSVAVGLWVGTGGRYEPARLAGISHFLEHMLFKGTSRRTSIQLSREIESVGGALNGFTGEEYTCYFSKVLHTHLRVACDILTDMFRRPTLRAADIEKEKGVIREEIHMYRDTPQHHVVELFNGALWGKHSLGRPIIGSPGTVDAISREELRSYLRRHYTPRNTVLAAAGRVTHEELVTLAAELLPLGGEGRAFRLSAPRARSKKPFFVFQRKETEQTHLCLGVRGYRRDHPDRYALHLLSIALGENMSSRLFQCVREKHGLAYAIHSSVSCFRDAGAFLISAGVENRKFLKALRMILKELSKIRDKGLRKSEMNNAREYCTGQLSMGLEKTTNNMLRLGENLLCSGHVLTREEIFSKLTRVTLDDIRKVADNLIRDSRLAVAAIGPLPESDETIAEVLHL